MSDFENRLREQPTRVGVFLALGVGFTFHYALPEYSTLGWVLGFAVVFPLIQVLYGDRDEDDGAQSSDDAAETASSTDDALETLRRRYAEGELTETQFERKVERLLETETVESTVDSYRVEHETE